MSTLSPKTPAVSTAETLVLTASQSLGKNEISRNLLES